MIVVLSSGSTYHDPSGVSPYWLRQRTTLSKVVQRWCKLVVQCCCKVAAFSIARHTAKVVQRCRKLVVQLRVQIDISDADKALLVGECKWRTKPVRLNILVDLQRKAKALQGDRAWQITYALFARSGFTPDLMALAQTEGILLVGPVELVAEQP